MSKSWKLMPGSNTFSDHTRWCPSSLAKLVQITPICLWFMADITIVLHGVYKPTYNWGAPSCTISWFFRSKHWWHPPLRNESHNHPLKGDVDKTGWNNWFHWLVNVLKQIPSPNHWIFIMSKKYLKKWCSKFQKQDIYQPVFQYSTDRI